MTDFDTTLRRVLESCAYVFLTDPAKRARLVEHGVATWRQIGGGETGEEWAVWFDHPDPNSPHADVELYSDEESARFTFRVNHGAGEYSTEGVCVAARSPLTPVHGRR